MLPFCAAIGAVSKALLLLQVCVHFCGIVHSEAAITHDTQGPFGIGLDASLLSFALIFTQWH